VYWEDSVVGGGQRQHELPTLPAGWEEALSRSTGQSYFINVLTGDSTYAKPDAAAAAAAADDVGGGT
jgi:hypothetical protein